MAPRAVYNVADVILPAGATLEDGTVLDEPRTFHRAKLVVLNGRASLYEAPSRLVWSGDALSYTTRPKRVTWATSDGEVIVIKKCGCGG